MGLLTETTHLFLQQLLQLVMNMIVNIVVSKFHPATNFARPGSMFIIFTITSTTTSRIRCKRMPPISPLLCPPQAESLRHVLEKYNELELKIELEALECKEKEGPYYKFQDDNDEV